MKCLCGFIQKKNAEFYPIKVVPVKTFVDKNGDERQIPCDKPLKLFVCPHCGTVRMEVEEND
jgi:hypothetical protein